MLGRMPSRHICTLTWIPNSRRFPTILLDILWVRGELSDQQWYYTAQILLLSRFIQRRSGQYANRNDVEFPKYAHAECSKAAEVVVDLLALLDRHKLLGHTSADIIHILSLATLFEGDSCNRNANSSL